MLHYICSIKYKYIFIISFMDLYHRSSLKVSRLITKAYSTSFYFSTRLMEKEMRDAIFAIYGFVRYADEIVDTFHQFDKKYLLDKFEADMKEAVATKISLNPILNAFQQVVNCYKVPMDLVDSFMYSMRMDLNKTIYNTKEETEEYIYGSAAVVGLMCLRVFSWRNPEKLDNLKHPAMMLGSAFQKVNFLRDLKSDFEELNRSYFSETPVSEWNEQTKASIIDEIDDEFKQAFVGIKQLPGRSKFAVLTAYYYYLDLLKKIKREPLDKLKSERIRVSNLRKTILMGRAAIEYKLKLV